MHRHLPHLCAAMFLIGSMPLLGQTGGSPTAQQPTTPPTTQRPTGQQPGTSTPSQEGSTTITGCLRSARADTSAADTKGHIYTLEVLDTASAGTREEGAPARGTTSPTTYALTAPESIGLGKHVGHQVQLTGTLKSPASEKGAVTGGAVSSTTSAPGAKPGGAHRTFDVTALKMLSAKCP